MAGRKPKPTHLRLVLGNPGRRPLPEAEPIPPPGRPVVPAELSDAAKQEFGRLCGLLEQMGVLTTVDQALLGAYAAAFGDWLEAEAALRKMGKVVRTPLKKVTRVVDGVTTVEETGGYPMPNPFLAIRNKAIDQMYKLGSEFGLSPVARTRINTNGAKPAAADKSVKYF